jgi:hypothetical protein
LSSIVIDTVPHGLQVTEYLVTEPLGGARRSEQLMVRLSRGLSLREFESTQTRGQDTSRVTGRVVDSMVIVATRDAPPATIPVSLPAFAGVIGATVSVLLDEPRVGATSSVRTIDPANGRTAARAMRIEAESLFVVTDSAVADSSGRWFAVHRDTVRAWRLVAHEAPPFDAWVDAQGLVVESRRPNGLRLRRTAFELAFENWRQAHPDLAVSVASDGSVVSRTWLASGVPRPVETLDSLRVRFALRRTRIPRRAMGGHTRRPGRSRARPSSGFGRGTRADQRGLAESVHEGSPPIGRAITRPFCAAPPCIAGDDRDRPRSRAGSSRGCTTRFAPKEAPRRSVRPALAGVPVTQRRFALLTTALARAAGVPAHPVAGLLHAGGSHTPGPRSTSAALGAGGRHAEPVPPPTHHISRSSPGRPIQVRTLPAYSHDSVRP